MQRVSQRYEELLTASEARREALPQERRAEVMQAWREVYAAGLHANTGRWKRDAFEWHVFSYREARSLCGDAALQAYRAETCRSVFVCPEEHRLPAFRLESEQWPDFSGIDVYVFPENLRWTMAFTHEQSFELGPYFSRAEWIVDQPRRSPR